MSKLMLYGQYTREDAHDIFAPASSFTPSGGAWGRQGIVSIPGTESDFVFFVTYGQKQDDYVFDESVSQAGVLRWQSQPSQKLHHPQIKQFINHDHQSSNIYLMLKTDKSEKPYTYLGRLAYLRHDNQRESPVHFEWQILNWNPPNHVREMLGLPTEGKRGVGYLQPGIFPKSFPSGSRKGQSTSDFNGTQLNYLVEPERVPELNRKGKRLVLLYEEESRCTNRDGGITHCSEVIGEHLGYDIYSQSRDPRGIYISAKTTRGGPATPFYLAQSEIESAKMHPNRYYIYRLYGFDEPSNSAKFYRIGGRLLLRLNLEPTKFRVTEM